MRPSPQSRDAVLVTGAAGFLGVRLLAELARSGGPVYGLVRADDDGAAQARLRAALYQAGLDSPPARVEALAGDVREGGLGLCADARARLATEVGQVFHCAAVVNAGLPYAALRATNVGGVVNVLGFCAQGRAKQLHLMSSTVAAPGLDAAAPPGPLPDAYARTKAVAETICADASERGFDVVVHRLGALAGDSRTGACNERDWRWLILRATLELGQAPLLPSSFAWLPVDDAARAIVAIAQMQEPPRRLLLSAPRRIPWLDVFSWLRRYGYGRLRLTDVRLWRERVAASDALELAALATAPIGSGAAPTAPEPVPRADAGIPGPPLRSLDERLLGTYLDAAVGNGAIPAPRG